VSTGLYKSFFCSKLDKKVTTGIALNTRKVPQITTGIRPDARKTPFFTTGVRHDTRKRVKNTTGKTPYTGNNKGLCKDDRKNYYLHF
jgi:hypothetical protein